MTENKISKKEQFENKMMDILNYGALNLAMGMGYRLHLFDVMEELKMPSTAEEISRLSKLNTRYVKEWLGVMTTGGIIELSDDEKGIPLYYLPPEHAAFLTRNAGNSNMGVYTQEIPMLTECAMASVINGFASGEGVPFSKYPDFQSFMAELSNAKHRQVLVEKFLPQVDGGNLVKRLKKGIRVCDLGCGEGVALNLMAGAFPRSRFTGIDTHEEALAKAEKEALAMSLQNTTYLLEDAADLKDNSQFHQKFDYICAFDAIHDQSRPLDALKSIRLMLSPGGLFSMVDIDAASSHAENISHPMGPFLYTVSLMHCMPVGLNNAGKGLGMMWGRKRAETMLIEAGFDDISIHEMAHDSFNVHYMCRV